uniref:Uncharacterized protein LOC114341030 n=1 Tax=Diabrotica virgifera virgifera TaxID=50390 RepID=A0A6P7GUU1_DIAVI
MKFEPREKGTSLEFTIWKQSVEETTCSFYVVSKYKQDNITYFNCNRSKTGHDGKQADKQYKRNCKPQGLFHLNYSCTSQIKVVRGNDKVTVNFQKTHYGHEIEVGKIRLPKQERGKVASKLVVGIPPKKIVQSVYDNIGEHLKRIDLLTMSDVSNINRSFGLEFQDGKRHENDAVSLDLWVLENTSKPPDENPILFYKSFSELYKVFMITLENT